MGTISQENPNGNENLDNKSKKLWKIQLESLEKLKEVCDKYGLKYYAGFGTLLGAARHQGYIPWDDDLDVWMLWSDYKKLLQVCEKENIYPWFFANYISEPEMLPDIMKLRRSDTTCCTNWEIDFLSYAPHYNKGVWIDIFPLFYIPDNPIVRWVQKKLIMFLWKILRGYQGYRNIKDAGFSKLKKEYEKYVFLYRTCAIFTNFQKLKEKYIKICCAGKDNSKMVGLISFRSNDKSMRYPANWFEETIELPFENTIIQCPKEYERILETLYGDWKTPVHGGQLHETGIINIDIPYTENEDVKCRYNVGNYGV